MSKIIILLLMIALLVFTKPVFAGARKLTPQENGNVRQAAMFLDYNLGMTKMADNIITLLDNGQIQSDPNPTIWGKSVAAKTTGGKNRTIIIKTQYIGGRNGTTRFNQLSQMAKYRRISKLAAILVHEKTHYHQKEYIMAARIGDMEAYYAENLYWKKCKQNVQPGDPDKEMKETYLDGEIEIKREAEEEYWAQLSDEWNQGGAGGLAELKGFKRINTKITWSDGHALFGWRMQDGKILEWIEDGFDEPDAHLSVSEEILDKILVADSPLEEAQRALATGELKIEPTRQDFIKGFSFKLTGGYGTMSVGDFNTVISSLDTMFKDAASTFELTKEGEFEKINWGLDFEGEFIMNLTENFGIGLGAGYIQRKKDSKATLKHEPFFTGTYTLEPKITAIPIKLSAYYFYPVASQMNIFLNGGIGYYFSKITYLLRNDIQVLGEPGEWEKSEGEVKDNALGFHGGIGFEYNIAKNIAFFVEGAGRYVKLKNWEGNETFTNFAEETEKTSGTMWFYEEYDSDLGKYYSSFELSKEKPTDPDIRNVRKLEGDLSGLSFRAGIRIKF